MDDSDNKSGEIFKIAQFLKSITGLDYSSQLPTDLIQKIVFGDINVLGLVFWTNPNNPDYYQLAKWVVIKEGLHHPKDIDVLDLFSQFHLFSDHPIEYYDRGLKVINRETKTELLLKFESKDYIYLRGTASVKTFT